MANDKLDLCSIGFFKLVGYEVDENTLPPIYENHKNEVFIKFMSEKGAGDVEQADAFEKFLVKYSFTFVRVSDRSFRFWRPHYGHTITRS